MIDWILHGTIPVGDGQLCVREVVGNVFGLASAILGVRSLINAGYYPTAGMYLVYAGFVLIGFAVWWRASRTTSLTPELEGAVA